MMVQVLGGSFGKLEGATFGTDEIIFPRKDGKHHDIVQVTEVARTFYADERNVRRPDHSPEGFPSAYYEARKTLGRDHDNKEVVVMFKDGSWAYIRTATRNAARIIKAYRPG